ncbi:MAG: DUF4398 domain-containing protein [Nitrospiraceae bacterium]|nr:MAG: DUF4398 domain-containing protein [Nitrospiraceae bacterium]
MRKEEHNMKKLLLSLTVALTMLVVLVSCAKQPTQEMNDTKAAIDAVIAEGGDKYAAEEVKSLNDQLTAATDEVKVQDGKFFKNYDKAKEMLAKVKADSDALKAEIPARKEKAKNDAVASLEAATTAVSDAKAMLGKAPKGKGTKADIEAMRADIAGLEASLAEVQSLIDGEDYMAALDKANGIKDKAAEVSNQITMAMEKKK